jgi:hypothetical protein
MKDYNVLIELDCLLDTRLGTVYQMNPDLVLPLLQAGYHNRLHNNLGLLNPDINQNLFLEKYKKRDINTLMVSRKTYLVKILAEFNLRDKIADYSYPESLRRFFTVNYYPYKLTPKQVEAYKEVLEDVLDIDPNTSIKMVSIPLEKLNVPYIKTNFQRMIFVNSEPWLTYFKDKPDGYKANPIPLIDCDSALCIRDDRAHEKFIEINSKTKVPVTYNNLVKQTPMNFAFHIKLDYFKLGDVSIDMHSAKEELKDGH